MAHVLLWCQSLTKPQTSHKNNENTTLDSLNSSQIFQCKHISCVAVYISPLIQRGFINNPFYTLREKPLDRDVLKTGIFYCCFIFMTKASCSWMKLWETTFKSFKQRTLWYRTAISVLGLMTWRNTTTPQWFRFATKLIYTYQRTE